MVEFMMRLILSSWAQKGQYTFCKLIFLRVTMEEESKDYVYGLIQP
uniref:Uncharacterized protein n=1 Tax=Cucumis melo TaxID=3656 RepID=A0A9I9E1T8_CUCME